MGREFIPVHGRENHVFRPVLIDQPSPGRVKIGRAGLPLPEIIWRGGDQVFDAKYGIVAALVGPSGFYARQDFGGRALVARLVLPLAVWIRVVRWPVPERVAERCRNIAGVFSLAVRRMAYVIPSDYAGTSASMNRIQYTGLGFKVYSLHFRAAASHFSFYSPITSCILLSVVLSLLFWLLRS